LKNAYAEERFSRSLTPNRNGADPAGSVAERSVRRTLEDFEVVDGEDLCVGARVSTPRGVDRGHPSNPAASGFASLA
jgi:hypothetical protein